MSSTKEIPGPPDEELIQEARREDVSSEEHETVLTPRHQRDPELVARVKSIRGRFAGGIKQWASEDLHRERQADKEKEEQQAQGFRQE